MDEKKMERIVVLKLRKAQLDGILKCINRPVKEDTAMAIFSGLFNNRDWTAEMVHQEYFIKQWISEIETELNELLSQLVRECITKQIKEVTSKLKDLSEEQIMDCLRKGGLIK